MDLREMLMLHEGLELKPYRDNAGKLTIGYGRNLDEVGISASEAGALLDNDMIDSIKRAKQAFPWFENLSATRQDVIIMMVFNMGAGKVADFIHMIEAIKAGDFRLAGEHMLDSHWARQVGGRAFVLSRMMQLDRYPDADVKNDPGAGT